MRRDELAPLVGDARQFASVRRIVLDEGPGRGVSALLFSTGGGLDFMVLADRAMDIGTLHWRGVPFAWQAPVGFPAPGLINPEGDGGRGFNRGFSGLLMTCGLDHVRQPRDGRPLHGRLPGTPARLLACGEAWDRDEPVLFAVGEAVQASYGGEALLLHRRIEAPIGGAEVRIFDEVENIGPEPTPQALLYHLNFGYPGVATGSRVSLDGTPVWGPLSFADPEARPEVVCLPAGGGPEAECRVTGGAATIKVAFGTEALPHLQLWRDLRPRVGVLAVEPVTSNRHPDGSSGPETILASGEKRSFRVRIGLVAG
jgi:hypothetical protein